MIGLITWLAIGCAVGFLHSRLPGIRPRWWTALVVGTASSLAGGVLTTVMGMGGVAAFDPRSTVVALLAAVLGLNVQRLVLARNT